MACAVPPPIPFSRPLPPPVSTPSLRNEDTNVSLSEDATDTPTTEGTLGPYETELLRRASKCRERAERYYWYARFLCFESDGKVMVAALPGHFDTGDFNVLREGQLEVHIKDGMFDPDTSRIVWDGQGEQWTETMSCRELEQTILFVEQPKLANTYLCYEIDLGNIRDLRHKLARVYGLNSDDATLRKEITALFQTPDLAYIDDAAPLQLWQDDC